MKLFVLLLSFYSHGEVKFFQIKYVKAIDKNACLLIGDQVIKSTNLYLNEKDQIKKIDVWCNERRLI